MALRHARESVEALNARVEEGLRACRQKNLRLWAHPSAMPGAMQSVLCRNGPLIGDAEAGHADGTDKAL